jgi:hypothetical protein
VYRLLYSRAKGMLTTAPKESLASTEVRSGLAFSALVAVGALSIGLLVNSLVGLWLGENSLASWLSLLGAGALLTLDVLGSVYLIYRLDLRTGTIRRRIRSLEVGWKN